MRIDPATVQLLFADAQTALVANTGTGSPGAIDTASGVLADCAALLAAPMTFSAVKEGDAPPTMLAALRRHADPVFVRDCASPFMDAAVVARLAATGRRTLVIAGFASEVVVLHAALDALAAGYDVLIPLDAVGSMAPRTEDAAMRHVMHAGGTVTSVATLVTMLAPDFSSDPGARVIAAVRTLSH